jgi:crotonobetainyl-CoA:carnitine CoA-transferase CaiB-like acyl-CoA transferase
VGGADLVSAFAARSADELVAVLADVGVPAVRADGISHAEFMLNDAHCRAVGVSVETEQPGLPRYWRAGPAVHFGAAPTPIASSPDLGAQTAAVLTELGYTDADIADLQARGVTRAIGHGLPG